MIELKEPEANIPQLMKLKPLIFFPQKGMSNLQSPNIDVQRHKSFTSIQNVNTVVASPQNLKKLMLSTSRPFQMISPIKSQYSADPKSSRLQSNISSSHSVINYDKKSATDRLKKTQFHKTAREQHLANIYSNLAAIKHIKNKTIFEIFTIFCDSIQATIKVKNQRFVVHLMNKQGQYNPKIKEFVSLFPGTPQAWTPEYLIKHMIQLQVDPASKQSTEVLRKFKLDSQLIDAVLDLNRILEETLIQLQEYRYETMASNLIDQNQILNSKYSSVKLQIYESRRLQQLKYLNDLVINRKHINIRVLDTNIRLKIDLEEEKNGPFAFIQTLTRHTSSGLDSVVQKLKSEEKVL